MKALFEELRAHERASVPAFDDVVRRRTRQRTHVVVLALAAALAVLLLWPRHMKDDVAAPSITQWRAPTDALLPDNYHSVLSFEGLP